MTFENPTSIPINSSPTPAVEAGKYISDLLALNVDKPVLLLVAGGSSTEVLDYINPEYLSSTITVTVTDERFTEDVEDNNFARMQTFPFYNDLIEVEAFCINTQLFTGDTIDIHAARFEKNIRDWKQEFPTGTIIALFGIGADGHIAGILPGIYNEADFKKTFDNDAYIAIVDATGKDAHPQRVTTTFPFMRLVDFPLFYVKGENKRAALEKVLAKEGTLSETPARIIQEMKKPEIFTDIAL